MTTFRDLPQEIRHIIWRYYLSNPRVIALKVVRENWQYRKVLYGERSWLHHVNREARQESLRVQEIYNPNVGEEPQFYVDFDLDVVWLIQCPQNGLTIGTWRDESRIFDASPHIRYPSPNFQAPLQISPSRRRIPRLAVVWEWWHKASVARFPGPVLAWAMKGFHDNNVVELLIVINSYMVLSKNKRIIFREPSQTPQHAFTMETPRLHVFLDNSVTWEELGNDAKLRMESKRLEFMNEMESWKTLPGSNLEALETRWSEMGIIGAEEWKVPEVRLVEAVQT